LALSCDGCNSNKRANIEWHDPETGVTVSLFNPRQDVWYNHFQWSDDFTLIISKTSTGRATIDLLKMNRNGLVNIRKALLAYGVFPQ
jgi:hypothetical protein